MSDLVGKGERGDLWGDAIAVVDERDDARVEALLHLASALLVRLVEVTDAARRPCRQRGGVTTVLVRYLQIHQLLFLL